jgi:hypothetical protein
MKEKRANFISLLMNAAYFLAVFAIAFAISTLALARRLNSYQANNTPFALTVKKEEVTISNTISGQVKKIYVQPGQHVKKSDLLIQLTDQATQAKIDALEKISATNLSARTEAEVLKTLVPQYEVRAPRDGIIYKVQAVEDMYLQSNSDVLTMFSDDNVKLIGEVSPEQYLDLLKQKKLDVFSSRREQVFGVKLEAVSKVNPATQYQASTYELYFQFVDPEDAASFIQGESVDVVAKTRDDADFKPGNLIMKFWNSLISGK